MDIFLTAAFSYLLGSIPFGLILVRIFRGQDIRLTGSGNIGATNVARSSPALGVLTLILDAAKGLVAVALTRTFFPGWSLLAGVAALFAILGHLFPIWLKFRGGKGVATGLGAFIVIAPKAVLIAAAIFVILVLIFRYVSLGSVAAVAMFPSLAWSLHEYGNVWSALAFMTLTSLLIVLKHRANIIRLFSGTENRLGRKPAIRADSAADEKL
jgi:glycerol-3-phosphate acyltransferase PlsY